MHVLLTSFVFVARTSFLETVNNIIQSEVHSDNNSVNSLEYWSDEEGRYPPQMSLSPIPGEAKFRKTTPNAMKYSRIFAEVIRHFATENVKQAWIVWRGGAVESSSHETWNEY